MPNWPPSSSCVMPSTVTGTTPYHHNDLKRLFMHNPLLNLPHLLLKRSSGGCQHHESSSEQKHELQAPRNQESCNREGDGGYSVGGKHEHASNSPAHRNIDPLHDPGADVDVDRKSTRLNSSHGYISYAVFCLKKQH